MQKVSASKYVEGVESIYVEQPSYEEGHDGSDGKCDCIGMCRGGLERAGAKGVTNMRGTNQAARKTIKELQPLETAAALCVGDVVLKTRDKDDEKMPLPDRYRKGGADYDPDIGEINFTHIGTVTKTDPLEITHMTSPTAKKDSSIKGWSYQGELPWVEYEPAPEPGPEPTPTPEPMTAVVTAPTGKTVNMRRSPSMDAALVERVPIGETVNVLEYGGEWCYCKWKWFKGYMMTCFLDFGGTAPVYYTVIIPGLTFEAAEELCMNYPNAIMEEERG